MSNNKILREQKTMENMVNIFCIQKHKEGYGLCNECKQLLEYSKERLNRCCFGTDKPVCARCKIHCYKQEMRDQIKQVMRYSGKRMILIHPVLTISHFVDLIY